MRGGAETVNAEPFGIAGFDKASITNQPGAEQRRGFNVIVYFGNRKTKTLIGDGIFGVAAVDRIAGELRLVAEVLLAIPAIRASVACPAKPGYADTIADPEATDGLV